MSQEVTLHLLPGATRSASVLVTAQLSKVPFKTVFHTPQSCKSDEYLKVHPFGKLPSAETPEGPLYESNTICRYFARKSKSLYGSNFYEEAQVDQWLDTIRTDFSSAGRFVYSVFGFPEAFFKYDLKHLHHDLNEFVKILKVVDNKLVKKDFLVGNSLTIADVTLVCDLSYFYKYFFTAEHRQQLTYLTAYFEKHSLLPEFRSVIGKTHYPEKPFQPLIVKEEKKAEKKEEKKAEKKEEKKAEKPKKEAEEEDDEPKEEKAKVYTFPESKFDLFAFKTMYVNAPNKADAVKFLFDNFDENAFSFWHLTYDKLPSEGKKLFLTNNLMNGFLDRADACRKYSLGVHGVFGDEPELDVKGVWLWRGTDMLEPLKEHQQFEVYKYRKLDLKNAADKKIIEEFWINQEEDKDVVEGKVVRTLKYFK